MSGKRAKALRRERAEREAKIAERKRLCAVGGGSYVDENSMRWRIDGVRNGVRLSRVFKLAAAALAVLLIFHDVGVLTSQVWRQYVRPARRDTRSARWLVVHRTGRKGEREQSWPVASGARLPGGGFAPKRKGDGTRWIAC